MWINALLNTPTQEATDRREAGRMTHSLTRSFSFHDLGYTLRSEIVLCMHGDAGTAPTLQPFLIRTRSDSEPVISKCAAFPRAPSISTTKPCKSASIAPHLVLLPRECRGCLEHYGRNTSQCRFMALIPMLERLCSQPSSVCAPRLDFRRRNMRSIISNPSRRDQEAIVMTS